MPQLGPDHGDRARFWGFGELFGTAGRDVGGLEDLDQAGRELLLAQSSDWAFIMKTGTMVDYAIRRTKEHVLRFTRLHDQLRQKQVDPTWLAQVESRDNLFPEIDYRLWAPRG